MIGLAINYGSAGARALTWVESPVRASEWQHETGGHLIILSATRSTGHIGQATARSMAEVALFERITSGPVISADCGVSIAHKPFKESTK